MATSGAQPGNQNAKKGKAFTDALRRALAARDIELNLGDNATLVEISRALVEKALEKDVGAICQIRDTLQGKPVQATEISGPDGGEIPFSGFKVGYGRPEGSPPDPET